jgi:hypothetical protein
VRIAAGLLMLLALACSGCTHSYGVAPAVLGAEAYPPAMVLATGIEGEDCGTSIFFVPRATPSMATAVARAVATVPEATLLVEATVSTRVLRTIVYDRACVRVRGSAAKLVSSVVLPMEHGGHGNHGHH